jgi:hypothetical protein
MIAFAVAGYPPCNNKSRLSKKGFITIYDEACSKITLTLYNTRPDKRNKFVADSDDNDDDDYVDDDDDDDVVQRPAKRQRRVGVKKLRKQVVTCDYDPEMHGDCLFVETFSMNYCKSIGMYTNPTMARRTKPPPFTHHPNTADAVVKFTLFQMLVCMKLLMGNMRDRSGSSSPLPLFDPLS